MLIIEKLNQKKDMSYNETCVADYVLALGKRIEKSSTRSIAEATYTSPATTIRFCKKLGFRGFDDFKEQYLKEIDYLNQQYGKLDVNFPFLKEDTEITAVNKLSNLYMDTIQDTLSLLKQDSLKLAVNLLKKGDAIHIFSYGTTLNIAESFREKMLKIKKPVYISSNLNYQLYEANALHDGDIAILISYSGETEKILKIANICKNRKVPMIIISSFGENTLSTYSSCKLIISTKENLFHNVGDFSTHISVSFLLDALYSAYFLQNYDQHYQMKLESVKANEGYRKSNNPIINDSIVEK